MPSLAIIGSGVAGLGCAHFLHRHFDLTVFEQNGHAGGHAHTVTVPEDDPVRPGCRRWVPIDTGFMVFNRVTYPHLTRLFSLLNVPVRKTDMSFSVRHEETGLEFCGSSLNHLFCQRRNLLRPSFYRMLLQVDRFNREALAALDDPAIAGLTLADYVRLRGYGSDFLDLYLVPMSSAVWSTPPDRMLGFPAATLLRFFHNHGFLGLHTQHQWWTVAGGSQEYVKRLTAPWRGCLRPHSRVTRVARSRAGVHVTTADGATARFDHAILAAHGHESLRLLADPTADETRLLREFQYQPNTATLHTDASVMPRTRLAWSAWNYSIGRDAAGRVDPMTVYWMNRLQGVSEHENYFVSINRPERIDPRKVLRTIACEHPLFTLGAVCAQREIPALNLAARRGTETYFCGAWTRYGFHEDGLLSAVNLARLLLGRDPWTASPAGPTAPAGSLAPSVRPAGLTAPPGRPICVRRHPGRAVARIFPVRSCLYECDVLHARLAPAAHRFAYRLFLFALDLDEIEQLPRRLRWFSAGRRNAYSFRDSDYLPTHEPIHRPGSPPPPPAPAGRPPSLKARLTELLAHHAIDLAGGRVLLVTLPRVFGYLFNPVSFYFCFDRHGTPVASVAEVTNTFREMKPFVLGPATRVWPPDAGERPAAPPTGDPPHPPLASAPASPAGGPATHPAPATFRLRTPKHFYVSPFTDVDVAFDFTLRTPDDRLAIRIDDYSGTRRTLTSTLAGRRRPLTDANLAWFTLKYPLVTLRIITLIHWHAALLWLKRVPWFAKAARPKAQRDLYRPHPSIAHAPDA